MEAGSVVQRRSRNLVNKHSTILQGNGLQKLFFQIEMLYFMFSLMALNREGSDTESISGFLSEENVA